MSWEVAKDGKGKPRIGDNSGLNILTSVKLAEQLNEAVSDKRLANIFRRGSQISLKFDKDIHIDCQTVTNTIEIYAVQQKDRMYASVQLKPYDNISLDEFRVGLFSSLKNRAVLIWSK